MNASDTLAGIEWREGEPYWLRAYTADLQANGIRLESRTFDQFGQPTTIKTLTHPLTPTARCTRVRYANGVKRDGYLLDICHSTVIDPDSVDPLACEFEVYTAIYRNPYGGGIILQEEWASGGFDSWRYFPGGFTMGEVIEHQHPR